MGERTVVLVGGNNGDKEALLRELLGRRQGGAWCYSYRQSTYALRLLPLCALQSPTLQRADCTVLVTPALDLQRALAAVPALWQRSHRLVVYITGMGAARRQGVCVDAAVLAARLGCPVVVATPYSSRGVNRLLAAVDRAVRYPPVPHAPGAVRMQAVWLAAVCRCDRRRPFLQRSIGAVALGILLWVLAAAALTLLLAGSSG